MDIYTRASLPEMNEKVLVSFKQPESKLRIVIATLAFGMSIDCPDIRPIITQFIGRICTGDWQSRKRCCSSEAILINVPEKLKTIVKTPFVLDENNYLRTFCVTKSNNYCHCLLVVSYVR